MADSELADLRKQCITSLYLCTDNVSKYLESDQDTEFEKLRSQVKEYCLLEAQQKVAFDAMEKAKSETNYADINKIESKFQNHLKALAGKRLNVDSHPYMLEFNNKIVKQKNRRKETLDESDIAITESMDQHLDPITKKPINDPVKNTECGHVYERESIMKLISMKSRTRCPVVGCGNKGPITAQHLVADEELRFRLTLTQHSTMVERSIMDLDSSVDQ